MTTKSLLIVVLTFVIIHTSGFFIHACSQSKSETISWINSKFPNTDIFYEDHWGNREVYTMKINHDGTYKITQRKYRKSGGGYTFVFTGNLKSMNPETISLEQEGKYFFVKLKCSGLKKCNTQETEGEQDETYKTEGIWFDPFLSSDEGDLDKRLLKAFKHLVKLLGEGERLSRVSRIYRKVSYVCCIISACGLQKPF